MMQAFTVATEGADTDKFLKVKEEWLDNKRKLEQKIIGYNKKQDTVKKILNLIKDRDSPDPKHKSHMIKSKYEEKKAREE